MNEGRSPQVSSFSINGDGNVCLGGGGEEGGREFKQEARCLYISLKDFMMLITT